MNAFGQKVAFFWRHVGGSGSIWPWANRGDLAALYCFVFLFIWASGGGAINWRLGYEKEQRLTTASSNGV